MDFSLHWFKVGKVGKSRKKVSFNIASEASYVYILSRQKFIKNARNYPIWRVFENLKLAVKQSYQTGHFFIGQRLAENDKIQKFKWDIFGDFQTLRSRFFIINEAMISKN